MKRLLIAAFMVSIGLAMVFAPPAQAVSVTLAVDPDGPGGANGTVLTPGLDWAPGNALIQNIESGISQVYAHSTLSAFIAPAPPVVGLNSTFEWTYILGVNTAVTQGPFLGGPNIATQLVTVGGGDNFFNIYEQAPPNANQLAGTGFNDGTLVLSGTILPGGLNNFVTSSIGTGPVNPATGDCGALDQFVANNYPGMDTVCGQGGGSLLIKVNFANPSFFPTGVPTDLAFNYTTQNNLPFTSVDPSALFDTLGGTATTPGATLTSIGSCNGCIGETAPNVMVQVDANSTFMAAEPTSLMLLGSALGLVSLARIARRRRSN